MSLLSANNMKNLNVILIVFLLSLSSNMQAKPNAYSKNTWNIQHIKDFENNYKKQEKNAAFLFAMLEQKGLKVYKADVGLDNPATQLTGNPVIKYVYFYPNLSEIKEGESYYRLKLIVDKYPCHINEILDLVATKEPPHDVYNAVAGLICSDFVFEEMIKDEESDDIEWNTLCVWKLKRELDNLFATKNQSVKVYEIYSIMEKYNLFANDIGEYSSSPWVDSEGRAYLRSLCLYSRDFEKMRKGNKYYNIQIELDFNGKEVDKDKFLTALPEVNYVPSFMNATKAYNAKNVVIKIDSIL